MPITALIKIDAIKESPDRTGQYLTETNSGMYPFEKMFYYKQNNEWQFQRVLFWYKEVTLPTKEEVESLIEEIQRLRDETGMCKCPSEQRTGDTQLMCCNNCGKRSEKF